VLKQFAVTVGGELPSARRKLKVDFQAAPSCRLVVEEPAGGDSKSVREEGQGSHGRLAVAGFEGTDVGLGVAPHGKLLLCESGSKPRLAQTMPDALGELGVVSDDPMTARGGSCCRLSPRASRRHHTECTGKSLRR
jgi:hypothetical protein